VQVKSSESGTKELKKRHKSATKALNDIVARFLQERCKSGTRASQERITRVCVQASLVHTS
jgi:hypothetical protein